MLLFIPCRRGAERPNRSSRSKFHFSELRIGATMAPAPVELKELRGRRHNTPIATAR